MLRENMQTSKISNNKKWMYVYAVVIIAFLLIFSFSYTYAYFLDDKEGTGVISFSKVELTLTGVSGTAPNFSLYANTSGLYNGSALLTQSVTIAKAANSEDCYIRVKLNFACADSNMTSIINYLNTNFNEVADFYAYSNASYEFVRQASGYLYLVAPSDTTTPIILPSSAITILDYTTLKVPNGITGTPTSSNVTITLTVEAVQSVHTNITTIPQLEALFAAD